ncbi:helix-turn-helix domain-containing protein [Streptomyces sp. NPDC102360]|uniref:helix-turn-helix domain-containing protein n=1 Tax=Streptomyces sp. NPDC102360 TaxID=3366160 RepID=UPI0037F8297A
MPTQPTPSLRQRQLGAELRRLREQAQISQHLAAEHIDGAQGKLSKIETGRQNIRRLELLALLDFYGVRDEAVRNSLVALLRERPRPGTRWWHAYAEELPPDLLSVIELEDSADTVLEYGFSTLPTLLQTPEYAEALIQDTDPQSATAGKFGTELRARRRAVLDRDHGTRFTWVLDEATLHRAVGDARIMAQQLRHLLELGSRRELSIRIVPFSRGGYPNDWGPFRVIRHDGPPSMCAVAVPRWPQTTCLMETAQVEGYRRLFDHLLSYALLPRQSTDVIARILAESTDRSGFHEES